MIESKEAKLQVETTAEFDANENAESSQQQQQQRSAQQIQQQQQQQPPTATKPDQNAAAPAAAVQHHDHDSEPKISHAQVHDISHGEPVSIFLSDGFSFCCATDSTRIILDNQYSYIGVYIIVKRSNERV